MSVEVRIKQRRQLRREVISLHQEQDEATRLGATDVARVLGEKRAEKQEELRQLGDGRVESSRRIKAAYQTAQQAVAELGRVLRREESGEYGWATPHKGIVTAMRQTLKLLEDDVPRYET